MTEYKKMVCEIQAVYKKTNSLNAAKIARSQDVNEWIRKVYPVDLQTREACLAVFLNRKNNTIGYQVVGIGGIASCIVDIRVIMQSALLCNATSFILCHNHPSGELKASNADLDITQKLKDAGQVMTIPLLDHLILTEEGYLSLLDEGLF